MPELYLLDTSAIFALTDHEEGAEEVEKLLRSAQAGQCQLLACSITLMELYYVTLQEQGEDEEARVIGLVKAWPLRWIYLDEKTLLLAGRLKASYRLSVADVLIAAVAKLHTATLVHKDPELGALAREVKLLGLPLKKGSRS